MDLPSHITNCIDQISTDAKLISAYLGTEQAKSTDSSKCGIIAAKEKLAEAAFELLNLSRDTGSFLVHLTVDYQVVCAFRWLCHFNIPRFVPLDGTISHQKLAQAAQAPEVILRSTLRLVMTSGLFDEPELGLVAHSPVSRQMATDDSLIHWVQYISNTIIPTAAKHLEATKQWTNSSQVNETAHNIAFNHDLAYFDFLSQQPGRAIEFARTMQAVSNTSSFDNCHLVESYSWSSIGGGLVVDVGGSTGHASLALAEKFPDLSFVVQDLPDVIADSVKEFDKLKLPTSIASRIQFESHSFFNAQSRKGASIYLLRHILHDWPNQEAIKIIRSIIPALRANSKIIISDIVLPEPAALPAIEERVMRMNDLLLHQFTNTSERTLQDWKAIFSAASERISVQRVYRNPKSVLSLMELSLAE
ncbi:O-methyltransferase [Plenodomus tracheiphilus IPT5]|uniref:O-methyltransferase n=1 Tax=Plenodomus tracheiphilus IPT5 TaxID=1408161 RepID=A0A6A7BED2_9PLEO|nr:O-methyltransferase [Plenodomus tracheiphilus IPT5]